MKPKDECCCSILNQCICFKHYHENIKLEKQQTAQEIVELIKKYRYQQSNGWYDEGYEEDLFREIKQKHLGDKDKIN